MLKELIQHIDFSKAISLDIETTGTDRFKDTITSVQLAYVTKQGKRKADFLEWDDYSIEQWTEFFRYLKEHAKLVTHNGKFDFLFIYNYTGVLIYPFADTLVMAHVVGELSLGLKPLVVKYFQDDYDIDTVNKTGKVTKTLIEYAIKDAIYTEKLYKVFKKKLKELELVNVYKHELRAYKAYIKVESGGVPVDPNRDKAKKHLQELIKPYEDKLNSVAKINWKSHKQVALILFSPFGAEVRERPKKRTWYKFRQTNPDEKLRVPDYVFTGENMSRYAMETYSYHRLSDARAGLRNLLEKYKDELKKSDVEIEKVVEEVSPLLGYGLGLEPVKYTDSGTPSTDEDSLVKLSGQHECIEWLKEWKALTKLESFIDSWDKFITPDGLMHPSFNITARTGRTTCKEPNLHVVGSFSEMSQNKQRELMEAL